MIPQIIGPEAEAAMDWIELTEAFKAGHKLPTAQINDSFLYRGEDTLLTRSAWIEGLGLAVKSTTIFPANTLKGGSSIDGSVTLYADDDGRVEAIIDFDLVTQYKTAGDSLLGARQLARPDSELIAILGAGPIAKSLYSAYSSLFPSAHFLIWNRTLAKAESFAAERDNVELTPDLEAAVRQADIVTSATMTSAPIIKGEWLQPGQHIDLVGAYRPDMRELDDEGIRRGSIHLDSRASTLGHIGEIEDPLSRGVISEADILSDYYQLEEGLQQRRSDEEITIFKNGGGAHLDLMTSRYILQAWQAYSSR